MKENFDLLKLHSINFLTLDSHYTRSPEVPKVYISKKIKRPGVQKYQKFRSTRSPEVPGVQNYQKSRRLRSPEIPEVQGVYIP